MQMMPVRLKLQQRRSTNPKLALQNRSQDPSLVNSDLNDIPSKISLSPPVSSKKIPISKFSQPQIRHFTTINEDQQEYDQSSAHCSRRKSTGTSPFNIPTEPNKKDSGSLLQSDNRELPSQKRGHFKSPVFVIGETPQDIDSFNGQMAHYKQKSQTHQIMDRSVDNRKQELRPNEDELCSARQVQETIKFKRSDQFQYIFSHDAQSPRQQDPSKRLAKLIKRLKFTLNPKARVQLCYIVQRVKTHQVTGLIQGKQPQHFRIKRMSTPMERRQQLQSQLQQTLLNDSKVNPLQITAKLSEEVQKDEGLLWNDLFAKIKESEQQTLGAAAETLGKQRRMLYRQHGHKVSMASVAKMQSLKVGKTESNTKTPTASVLKKGRHSFSKNEEFLEKPDLTHLQNNDIENVEPEADEEDEGSDSHCLTEEEDSEEGRLFRDYFSEDESYYIEGQSISKYEIIEVASQSGASKEEFNNSFSLLQDQQDDEHSNDQFPFQSSISPSCVCRQTRRDSRQQSDIQSQNTSHSNFLSSYNRKRNQILVNPLSPNQETSSIQVSNLNSRIEITTPFAGQKNSPPNVNKRIEKLENAQKILKQQQDCLSPTEAPVANPPPVRPRAESGKLRHMSSRGSTLKSFDSKHVPLPPNGKQEPQNSLNGVNSEVTSLKPCSRETPESICDQSSLLKIDTSPPKSGLIKPEALTQELTSFKIIKPILMSNSTSNHSMSNDMHPPQLYRTQGLVLQKLQEFSEPPTSDNQLGPSEPQKVDSYKEIMPQKIELMKDALQEMKNTQPLLTTPEPKNQRRKSYLRKCETNTDANIMSSLNQVSNQTTQNQHLNKQTTMQSDDQLKVDQFLKFAAQQGSQKRMTVKNKIENKSTLLSPKRKLSMRSHRTISTNSCVSLKKGGKKQINQYVIIGQIGRGQFAKVKKILCMETRQTFAMKIINKQRLKKKSIAPKKSQFTLVEKEVAIMKKMNHPYVLRLVEIIDDPNHHKQYLIQEFVANGNLQQQIDKSGETPFTEAKVRTWFTQLLYAVWYCHEVAQIIHRDIKPENILLDTDFNIKLSDFGVSDINSTDEIEDNAGSACYFCPEECNKTKYSGKAADMWSCAVTLYQLVFKALPFNAKNQFDLYKEICHFEPSYEQSSCHLSQVNNFENLVDLLKQMLNKDPNKRITMPELETHPWLTENGTQQISWEHDVEYAKFEDVTEDDLAKAMTNVTQMKNVIFKKKEN